MSKVNHIVPIADSSKIEGTATIHECPIVYTVGCYKSDSPNGINKVIYSYGQILNEYLDFHVVTLDLDEWDGYREEIVDNVTIHHFGKPRLMNFQLPPRLKSWLRSSVSKEALFHLHGVFNPPNYSWARELTHLDYKYIYTPQDSYSPPSLRKKYWLKRLYIQLCEKLILNNAKSVQAVTDQGLIDIGKYTQNRIRLIPHFVMRFNAEMPPLDERKHICFVGRLDILQKGVDLMLEAYHHLKLIMDNPPQFILVGPEFEGSMPELKRICSKLGLKEGDEIIFAGRVSEDEKKRILNQSRVYLQLSRFEGFGMSTVEALSLGVPVIITEHIPIHKSIQNHHGGYTVRDIQEAAQMLRSVIELSADDYKAACENARNTYETLYSPEAIRAQIINMYREA